MRSDPNRPEPLLSVPNEFEAGVIVSALAEYGIEAITAGDSTAGFNASAPGAVTIMVKQADLDRAKQAFVEIQQKEGEVDWSKVDVMEGAEEEPKPDQTASAGPWWRRTMTRFEWVLAILVILNLAAIVIIGPDAR